ncbi:TRAP transporter small permease [Roseibium aestuarii]|uniref:TRAP transporter small permease protein n=1 Tax=Roseibium aestuarii TaxID=2600299 RepID=A0ABW4JYB5_9HYPH|nr:TRAP transporter small permease [Roseibium aestuarii]
MRNAIDTLLRSTIVVIFSILVVCVSWQVISRFILGTPSTSTDELARFLFMWLALIGGAYTLGQRRHLAIDLLTLHLSGRRKMISELVIIGVIALFCAIVMVYGGGQLVVRTLSSGQVTPSLQLPMGYVYGAIPFAGLVMLYYCLTFCRDLFAGRSLNTDAAAFGPLD